MLQQDPGIMDQFGVDPAPIRVPGSIKSKVVVSFMDDSFNLVGCSCGTAVVVTRFTHYRHVLYLKSGLDW